MLAVFGVSMAMPIGIFYQLRISANNAIIQQNMESVKNWAMIYKIKKGDYVGLEKNVEIVRKKKDLKDLGTSFAIHIDSAGKSYCATTNLLGFSKNKIYCVDSFGYSGIDGQTCDNSATPKCK